MAAGLKCGGTVQERAQRLFSTKGKRKEDLDKALLAKKRQTQVPDAACTACWWCSPCVLFASLPPSFALLPRPFSHACLQGSGKGDGEAGVEDSLKNVAQLEAQVYRLAELLSDVRAASKENVERRQVRARPRPCCPGGVGPAEAGRVGRGAR